MDFDKNQNADYVQQLTRPEFQAFLGKNIAIVNTAYPQKSVKFDTLTIRCDAPGGRLQRILYDTSEHVLVTTPTFLATTLNAIETQNPLELLRLSRCFIHEFMHVISSQKLARTETQKGMTRSRVRSGISIATENLRTGEVFWQNEGLNEYLTDFFAYELLKKDEHFALIQEASSYSVAVGEALIRITGRDTLNVAYFEGNTWKFEKVLKKGGVNSILLFSLFSDESNIERISRAFAMLGLRLVPI